MKQTAVEWLIDEAMKLVVQYMQGTLNEDTLDNVIYEIGTKAKAMEKKEKLKHSLFIGKVTEILGFDKTVELLKQCNNEIR